MQYAVHICAMIYVARYSSNKLGLVSKPQVGFHNHLQKHVKIRVQRARLCRAPWKGAKHRVFMRQVSPLSRFCRLAGYGRI